MTGVFNTALLGAALDAAEVLDRTRHSDDSADLVRVALINALRRIDQLEQRLAQQRQRRSDSPWAMTPP